MHRLPPPAAEIPAPIRSGPAHQTQAKYAGLGHGLPSHMRASRKRLSSIPEEVEATINVSQHADLGLGHPSSVLRQTVQKHSSSSPQQNSAPALSPRAKTPFKSRLESTVHQLFSTRKFGKRTLFSIPEARSPDAVAEAENGSKGRTASWVEQQQRQLQQKQQRMSSASSTDTDTSPSPSSSRLQMSPIMLLAAQSIMEEDRKFRKKEGLEGVAPMSPTMRLASQMVELQEEERKLQKLQKKQAGMASKKFKFLF
ncbi:hypothetical protein MSAN_00057800 [Mycena sanguinolenta]|uniref:Uncharacterized protein n=1 Tax=Mycena sanguinolenta TaxID=230812 RepID=A0A8H7DL74_9AGAR|nr:hypothetical protein MSAN_00057800 [Mycena sanguinolenta]